MLRGISLPLFALVLLVSQSHASDDLEAVRERLRESISARPSSVAVETLARKRGYPVVGSASNGGSFRLDSLASLGRPHYLQSENVNAAITVAVDVVRAMPPYDLTGAAVNVGLWDAAHVPDPSHSEFQGSHIFIVDQVASDNHAQHMAGTIVAQGNGGQSRPRTGMAPAANLYCHDSNSTESEMVEHGATASNQEGKYVVSVHPYGAIAGWSVGDYAGTGTTAFYWFGSIEEMEDYYFGLYSSQTMQWDAAAYACPFFTIFKSAGNDRSDRAPLEGANFYYWDTEAMGWTSAIYDPAIHPTGEGVVNGGYDTLSTYSNAKNIVTVGAVGDAVLSGSRFLPNAVMPSFSCWGPTDDGRIKPDIVGNGVTVTSCYANSPTSYGTLTGTSPAVSNVGGASALLVEHYRKRNGGTDMLSSTLKGLIIHTADDLGEIGPDYSHGWGLLNIAAAADLVARDSNRGGTLIQEIALTGESPSFEWKGMGTGSDPVRVTICWTDPPGSSSSTLDNPALRLVNDLDLRILGPDGVQLPYILDPQNPQLPATRGDNVRDNVEQVLIEAPPVGDYTIRVTHKGELTHGEQAVSVVVSGLFPEGGVSSEDWGIF